MDQTGIGWGDIVKIVLASGVVSALVSHGLQWLRDYHKEKHKRASDARYVAVRLIGELERYAVAVYREIKWHERASAEYQYYETRDFCPIRAFDPADSKLDLLSGTETSRIEWIKTEVDLALWSLSDTVENDYDPENYARHRMSLAGYFGYLAASLASDMRKSHVLPSVVSGWTMDGKTEFLKKYYDRSKKDLQ